MVGVLASDLGFSYKPYDNTNPPPSLTHLYTHAIPNVSGKSAVGLRVEFVGGAATPPHTHAGAFVAVTVLSGMVFNKMNEDPLRVFKAGECFFEHPGCHHVVSENFSKTEPAALFVTFIVDTVKLRRDFRPWLLLMKSFCHQRLEARKAADGRYLT